MPKGNPTNPHVQDVEAVRHAAPMPVQRAVVTSVDGRSGGEGAVHTAIIRVYGDPSPYQAVVLTDSRGDVNVPTEGDDVAVAFGPNEKPFIVGYWYADDKVRDGRVDLPDYEPGDRVIGHPKNSSYIRIDKDGDIHINSEGDVFINGTKQ